MDDEKTLKTNYLDNISIIQCKAGALHSAIVSNSGDVYTFGCGSDGRMGLKAYVEGASGQGQQRMKFYVSKPTAIELFKDNKNLKIIQADLGRRHMIALGIQTNLE